MPSQTFIRREIAALEGLGCTVRRFAARRPIDVVDDLDVRSEGESTRALLEAGVLGLAAAVAAEAVGRPGRWLEAVATTIRLAGNSDRGFLRHFVYLAEACLLRRVLEREGARHLHVHFGTNAADVAVLCGVLGGPSYSFTIHGPEEFDSPRALNLRTKIERAEFVVAISEYTRGQIFRWCRSVDRAKIHVIRCGLDGVFKGRSTSRPPVAPRLVNVGRLSEQKGQFLLIEAAARLRDRGLDFEIEIVGDGPTRAELERLIERLDLGDRVRITGFLSNEAVREKMLAARALVLPSLAEGLPVVVMESLALGRPVISTMIAGIPELVEPGISGWLVPAGAIEPLVDAMSEALTAAPEDLERMGRAGAERVFRRHDVELEVGKLAELFARAAGSSRNPAASAELAAVAAEIETGASRIS